MNKLTLQTPLLEQNGRMEAGLRPLRDYSATDAPGDRVKDFFSRCRRFELTLLDGQRVTAVPNWLGEA